MLLRPAKVPFSTPTPVKKNAGYTAEIAGLEANIKELSDEIDEREAANSTADEDRKEEAAAYKKRDDNYKTTIEAIEGALKGLKGGLD